MNPGNPSGLVDVFVLRSLGSSEADGQEGQSTQRFECCLELHGVIRMRSYLAADGRRMVCHYRAPDAESLRTALRAARIEYDVVWTAQVNNAADAANSTGNYTLATTLLSHS